PVLWRFGIAAGNLVPEAIMRLRGENGGAPFISRSLRLKQSFLIRISGTIAVKKPKRIGFRRVRDSAANLHGEANRPANAHGRIAGLRLDQSDSRPRRNR